MKVLFQRIFIILMKLPLIEKKNLENNFDYIHSSAD